MDKAELELCKKIASFYSKKYNIDHGTFLGLAWEGMMQAKKRYDPDNEAGASFDTYAGRRMKGIILDWMRQHIGFWPSRTMKRENIQGLYSLDYCNVIDDEGGTIKLEVVDNSTQNSINLYDAKDALDNFSKRLTKQEAYVLLQLSKGKLCRHIALELGVTESRVVQVKKKIFQKAERSGKARDIF